MTKQNLSKLTGQMRNQSVAPLVVKKGGLMLSTIYAFVFTKT